MFSTANRCVVTNIDSVGGRVRSLEHHAIAVELAAIRQISYLSSQCPYWFCVIPVSFGEPEVLVVLVYQSTFMYVLCLGLVLFCSAHVHVFSCKM